MDDDAFDRALMQAAFALASTEGWQAVTVGAAARWGGLPLDRARARFPSRGTILLRLGRMADEAALAQAATEPTARERLFDILMRRFDAMQPYRDGIGAMLRALPADPAAALLLYGATLRSMGWMLEGAGVSSGGPKGGLRAHGLLAVWTATAHAFVTDDSADLAGTMAELDRNLAKAEQVAGWLRARTSTDSSFDAGTSKDPGTSDDPGRSETGGGPGPGFPPPPPIPDVPASPPL